MTTRGWIPITIAAAITAISVGCGGGSTTNVQNPPPPPSQSVSIAFNPAPPASIPVNATADVTAVVKDDSSNAGVDWSLTCQNAGNCGSLAPLHTESGKAATYTPPANMSGNTQTVSISAFATADHTKNAVSPITVVGFAGNLQGTYILQTTGTDISGAVYEFVAAVTLDGNGGVTSGEQTYSSLLVSVSDPITGGSYTIGADGRGTLALNTTNQNLGQSGVETFSMVLLSNAHALIARLDNVNFDPTSETSSGTMDLQTSKAVPSAGYAFVVSGTDISFQPTAVGGVLNIDSPGTISGTGSVADQDLGGFVTRKAAISGTVSSPDPFGVVKFDLTADFSFSPLQFTGYIVDANHIKLIETDLDNDLGVGAVTAGVAVGQGTATGTFTDNTALSGKYVFAIFGQDLSVLPGSLASAGVFTADGAGHLLQGFNDEFLLGLGFQIKDNFHGDYAVDPTGTGRVHSSIRYQKPQNGSGAELIFYLTGNGSPPLILDADKNVTFGPTGSAAGAAYLAVNPATFSGKYGLSYRQSTGSENDAVGEIIANDSASTLAGVVDTNFFFSPVPNTVLNGTFKATPNHRYTGTLSNELFQVNSDGIQVAYYLIDSDHGYFVETDSINTFQVTFGYFARRASICPDCP